MSKVFRRPMFRKGGNVGEGIMTGIRDNFSNGSTRERLAAVAAQYPSQALDPLTQFLIQGGLSLASQPATGGGAIADIATAIKQPTAELMSGLAKKGELERKLALEGEMIDIEGDIKKDVAQIQQRGALDIKKDSKDLRPQILDMSKKLRHRGPGGNTGFISLDHAIRQGLGSVIGK